MEINSTSVHRDSRHWQGFRDIARFLLWILGVSLLALIPAMAWSADDTEGALAERQPLAKVPVRAPIDTSDTSGTSDTANLGVPVEYRLIVKFRDDVKARSTRGALVAPPNVDLAGVDQVARSYGMAFSPLIQIAEETLQALETRAAKRSRTKQPDLAGLMIVALPGADASIQEAAGNALQALPEVEFAHIQTLGVPPPGDIKPPTPNHVGRQTYRGPNSGIDVDDAWSRGFTGEGVRFSDCEYGWVYSHEDLVDKDLHPEHGQTIHPDVAFWNFDEHGTAVLGETSAVVNGYGVSGMIPDSEVYTYPEWTVEEGYRRVAAITHAIADSQAGDVVLLEMQSVEGGPAELDPAVWTVVKAGTDAGVVVVAAAGNGDNMVGLDLDSKAYADYMGRGDSGAILVGAGTSDTNHNKLSFSTYGSRVDVQGWGEGVFTLGYGHFATYGSDENQRYTHQFNGTSSASPMVASAAVILQEAANKTLSPMGLRQLLIGTGIPQGSGGHIGPFVNLRAALDQLLAPNEPPTARFTYSCQGLECSYDGSTSTDDDAIVSYLWIFPDGSTASGVTTSFFFPDDGFHPVTLHVTDNDGATSTTANG